MSGRDGFHNEGALLDVLFIGTRSQRHHFGHVHEEIARFGGRSALECAQGSAPVHLPVWRARQARVIVHAESVSARAAGIVAAAQNAGRPCVLLMDGACEFANTYLNPDVGSGFLRPAPGDLVISAGSHDRAVLRAMGNKRVVSAGLPRIDRVGLLDGGRAVPEVDLLVATARTPAMTRGARSRLVAALGELRCIAERRGLSIGWRVHPDIAESLGLEDEQRGGRVDQTSLDIALARARAVVTTASTVATEAMVAGRPVGVVHPHTWALWSAAPLAWIPSDERSVDEDARVKECARFERAFDGERVSSCEDFLDVLCVSSGPDKEVVRRAQRPRANERVARLLLGVARCGDMEASAQRVKIETPPSQRLRVVSCIESHGASVGGVSVWSERMERCFGERPELGIEWRTLFVGASLPPESERVGDRPYAQSVAVDPTVAETQRLRTLADALEGADVVLPNYSALCVSASRLAQRAGARVIAIAHTNDSPTRTLMERCRHADAFVAVNPSMTDWLAPLASGVPLETILYGVPLPPEREQKRGRDAPLRIAAVGRVAQRQKRVFDLIDVLCELDLKGVDYRFVMAGDGEDLHEWTRRVEKRGIAPGRVSVLGAVSPGDVQHLLCETDVYVSVSGEEGTSIAMLEAMGASVTPCVTDVAGVRAVIQHGVNGLLSPVGEPARLASQIVDLAGDRAMLDALATGARRTVQDLKLDIASCAEAYAGLLQRVCERAPATRRASASIMAQDRVWVPRGAALEEEVRAVLNELANDGAPIEIVRATDPHPGREAVEALRDAGVFVEAEPTLDDDAQAHLTHAFEELVRAGRRRIAVVCAGARTLPAAAWIARERREHVGAFLVPGACDGGEFFGVPARSLATSLDGHDAVLTPHPSADLAAFVGAMSHGVLDQPQARVHGEPIEIGERIRCDLERVRQSETILTTFEDGVIKGAAGLHAGGAQCLHLPASTAVFLRGDEGDFALTAELAGWMERGGTLASAAWALDELTSPARYAQLIGGVDRPVALYGAGLHTRRLLAHAPVGTGRPDVILDDRATAGQRLSGIAVRRPDSDVVGSLRTVILSSPVHEEELARRAQGFCPPWCSIIRLYG